MSNKPETTAQVHYEHFSPSFYAIWGDEPSIISKAQGINRLIETYLYVYGAKEIWELPPKVQDYVNDASKIRIDLEELDD